MLGVGLQNRKVERRVFLNHFIPSQHALTELFVFPTEAKDQLLDLKNNDGVKSLDRVQKDIFDLQTQGGIRNKSLPYIPRLSSAVKCNTLGDRGALDIPKLFPTVEGPQTRCPAG